MKQYSVSLSHLVFRKTFRPIFRLLFYILSNVKIIDRDNIPEQGPYLITMNHVSLYDPPLLMAFWPVAPEALGAFEVWNKPGQGILVKMYGGIPVHRGEYDRQALEKIIAAVNSGRPLLMAPEGRRSHGVGMQRAMPGVAYIADKTGVPVVPVGISGTTDDFINRAIHFQRPTAEMRIGKPIILPRVEGKGVARREALQANANLIMNAIGSLLPPDYRGIYQASTETHE